MGEARPSVALQVAHALIEGFNKHYRLFREASRKAKDLFDAQDWPAVHLTIKERIRFYETRVRETVERLRADFRADEIDFDTWQGVKLLYIGMLINHKQPELAETFFNSVTTKILHRNYFHNDFIFVRPAVSTEYIESDPPTYRSYYPGEKGLRDAIRRVFLDFEWRTSFEDLDRDVNFIVESARNHLKGAWPKVDVNFQIQVLASAFYRNKAAYVIGKAVNGPQEYPFAVPVLHGPDGRLYLDTVLFDSQQINVLFSLSRAYFMVDMEVPSGYVQFLRSIMPNKPRAELYTMIGLGKQGKTIFFRDLIQHLRHSDDMFIEAPGIRGLVMLVFTLPSYPYVFKIIKDIFGSSKDTDRATVKSKFVMVKQVDRVGRMADTLEFSDMALPKDRFAPELVEQLRQLTASVIEENDEEIVIRHLYIERRMTPLNLYLETATPEQVEAVVFEYGNAIRELATANIFPGDLLWKNFGVTRYGRVVFYDYDEIEYLTDCNFRRIPEAPTPELEMSGEVWYSVARNDVFPEEFRTFLLTSPVIRKAFVKHHADLLAPEFWKSAQEKIRAGKVSDFFPYPEKMRFCRCFANPPGPSTAA